MSFAPPPRIGTEFFTRLPDRFRRPRASEWARWNRGGRLIDGVLAGPCLDAAGRLCVIGIPFGRVFILHARPQSR